MIFQCKQAIWTGLIWPFSISGLLTLNSPSLLVFSVANYYYLFIYLDAGPPSPADHLRQVFYRMGLNDKVIPCVFHKDGGKYWTIAICL